MAAWIVVFEDRRKLAAQRAVAVAVAYELSRQADVSSTELGDVAARRLIRATLTRLGCVDPSRASADLVSEASGETRIIEVKGRGSSGPIAIIERELETLRAARNAGWLYVVWNTTQPGPFELWTVPNAGLLAWVMTREAERPAGIARGTRHEARFELDAEAVERAGHRVDLSAVAHLPVKA